MASRSLAVNAEEDDLECRRLCRPFLLSEDVQQTDWGSQLELAASTKLGHEDLQTGLRPRVLALYGSLCQRHEQLLPSCYERRFGLNNCLG